MTATLSDAVLCIATFVFAFTVGEKKRHWTALFFCLGLAAGFGALFHGISRFHTREFWTLVSTSAMAGAFTFLACVLSVVKPSKKWIQWFWPLFAVLGILVGAYLSAFPFLYISIVSGAVLILSLLLLPKSPQTKVRNWLILGIGITFAGLVAQHWVGNSIFHYFQVAANGCFWLGAKAT